MRSITISVAALAFAVTGTAARPAFVATAARQQIPAAAPAKPAESRLGRMNWLTAAERLSAETLVVLPVAAAAEQHGPHLPLDTDLTLAEYLSQRLVDSTGIVIAPAQTYHYSPASQEYPGSTSLPMSTARDLTVDVVRSLSRHGPRRYYALNTGLSAPQALSDSARVLAEEGILLRVADARTLIEPAVRKLQRQVVGRHADEIETSMMLYVQPAAVEMTRAVREYGPPSTPLRLTRRSGGQGTYSASGVWGDPTLATREKGRELVEALVAAIRAELDLTRTSPLPGAPRSPVAPAPRGRALAVDRFARTPGECQAGDDRTIRSIGPAFQVAWMNRDADRIGRFWTIEGDMVHPDGFVERSAQVIRQNRATLFVRREYQGSRHALTIGQVRCLSDSVAMADGKWELAGVTDSKGQPVPAVEGLCTLVLQQQGPEWRIEAYRYSIAPQSGSPPLPQRPGLPGGVR